MNEEISMAAIGAACDAIQDSARALNLRVYADSIAKQLEMERAQRQGNQGLQAAMLAQANPLQNALAVQQLGNYWLGRGGNWQ